VGKKYFSNSRKTVSEAFLKRKCLLSHSFHDTVLDEIVFTKNHSRAVFAALNQTLGYVNCDLAEYGEVLVWPGGESPSLNKIT